MSENILGGIISTGKKISLCPETQKNPAPRQGETSNPIKGPTQWHLRIHISYVHHTLLCNERIMGRETQHNEPLPFSDPLFYRFGSVLELIQTNRHLSRNGYLKISPVRIALYTWPLCVRKARQSHGNRLEWCNKTHVCINLTLRTC